MVQKHPIYRKLTIINVPNWRNSKNLNSVKRKNQRRYTFTLYLTLGLLINFFSRLKFKCNDKIHKYECNIFMCVRACVHVRDENLSMCTFACILSVRYPAPVVLFIFPSLSLQCESRNHNKVINLVSTLSPFSIALIKSLIVHIEYSCVRFFQFWWFFF